MGISKPWANIFFCEQSCSITPVWDCVWYQYETNDYHWNCKKKYTMNYWISINDDHKFEDEDERSRHILVRDHSCNKKTSLGLPAFHCSEAYYILNKTLFHFHSLGAVHILYNAKNPLFWPTPLPLITLYNRCWDPPTPILYNKLATYPPTPHCVKIKADRRDLLHAITCLNSPNNVASTLTLIY